ncbi:substrate-binding domain-containing protein [Aneurinibacillus sp. Ricciae_BoGa-3]|uniref:sugar ABC transporter substrate-binding protein n=1 Tax=Aneurinibacillus sp. Ricciae_BoGa-3 TaxID=3022697 RepID=UPI00234131F8|nr:substrate-binding domain-containing protein [Aneurinibacillus sp. Ricciae_BoGa-3]WCK56294.1 substrate-binding domain-containing protein [Aneurinibacillus sp. Ricciae_BoGa-3]
MKKGKKALAFAFLTTIAMAAPLAGCSSTKESSSDKQAVSTSAPNSTNATKKLKIGLSMNTLNNPFFVAVKEGAEAQAKAIGAELIVTDAQNNVSTQLSNVESMIQQKPDVIIIDPTDSDAIVPAVQEANQANIPILTIDRKANGGEVVAHVGFDAVEAGKMAGDWLAKELKGKGNVVEITGIMGTNVAQDRDKGFNEVMKQNPGIKIVAKQTANFDRGEALKVMENIIQANPRIDAVYAANDEMAIGAEQALEAANLTGKVKIVGTDDTDPMKELIKQGKANATVANPPYFLGKDAVKAAKDLSDGKKLEKDVILKAEIVKKDNVDQVKTRD